MAGQANDVLQSSGGAPFSFSSLYKGVDWVNYPKGAGFNYPKNREGSGVDWFNPPETMDLVIPTMWWRHIHDIFAIWPHGEEHLTLFLDGINNFHPSIKFTAKWSYMSVTFLDTKSIVDDEGRLVTDLYVNPTDTHQYLHRRSSHPGHCKRGVPNSHALRMRRICSRTENYLGRVNQLKGHLINKGYDKDEVQTQIDKATRLDRSSLLQSTKDKTSLDRVPSIVTYHPGLPPPKNILNKHLPILNVSHRLSSDVNDPPLVAYHHSPN